VPVPPLAVLLSPYFVVVAVSLSSSHLTVSTAGVSAAMLDR
jgi:hypothetical protein